MHGKVSGSESTFDYVLKNFILEKVPKRNPCKCGRVWVKKITVTELFGMC